MDQVKIGKFIAECRKELGLTQLQLSKMLSVTDRAVSKWECGKAMPDSSIMIDLCDILKISVNDLLCGERLSRDNYALELEKNLIELTKQKEACDRHLLTLEWVIGILSVIVLLVPIIIAAYVPMQEWQRTVVAFSGFIPCLVGVFFTLRIEQMAGYYECRHCHHKYVPTYKDMHSSMHIFRTRYMKCPKCNKKSWQRKVITKD